MGGADFSNFGSAMVTITQWISQLIPLVISIALLVFLVGIVQYVTAGGDEEKRTAARGMIIFGVIALFVMVSVWGFVNILARTFFGSGQSAVAPAYVPQPAIPNQARGR